MIYYQIRTSRPPPLFEIQIKHRLSRLIASGSMALPPIHLMERLRSYIESFLLAENLPPTTRFIAMLFNQFTHIANMTQGGKPFIYKKQETLSLLFDVFALQSEMRVDDPYALIVEYTQAMMGFLLFKPFPRKIGMVGLGGGSLAKYCYRHIPDSTITVAEIDPQVIALRQQFFIPEDNDRLQVQCIDGADFIQQADRQFDVLMIDGFDSKGQPKQLSTQNFYDNCYQALAPDGLLVVNLLLDTPETEHYLHRINCSFNGFTMAIDSPDGLNKIVFACKDRDLRLVTAGLRERVMLLESSIPTIGITARNILLEQKKMTAPPADPSMERLQTALKSMKSRKKTADAGTNKSNVFKRYVHLLNANDRDPRSDRHLGYLLSFVAGAVNAGGFLAIGQYTSHMSGIISSMADNLALAEFIPVISALAAWLAFILGAATTAILVNMAKRRQLHSQFALSLLLESGLLLLFGLAGANLAEMREFLAPMTVLLLCFIMGLQNALITKVSGAIIRTTHMTGVSTDLGIEIGKLFYFNRRTIPNMAVRANREKLLLHFLLLMYFFTGGLIGALGFKHIGYSATIIFSALLALLVIGPIFMDVRLRIQALRKSRMNG